jgi:hypothetical protein
MATRAVVRTRLATNVDQFQWTGLLNGDDGAPVELFDFTDGSIEFSGTAGVGLSISWQGGNVAGNYYILNDAQAALITKTAAALEQIAEVCRFMRPIVTAGDGSTNMVATLYMRRGRS